MLVGIVKKNAIMMIDFALEAQRREAMKPLDAIYQGRSSASVRSMTTMAALMGTLPIAIGFGAGADSRRFLGLAVVGGLIVSELLTLYITPVVYYYMDRLQEEVKGRFGIGLHRQRRQGLKPDGDRCIMVESFFANMTIRRIDP